MEIASAHRGPADGRPGTARSDRVSGAIGRPPAGWPLVAMAGLCLAAAALIATLGSRLTFFNDDWYFLLQRPGLESGAGLDALLAPHNGGMVVPLAATFKVLVALFGLGAQLPFRLLQGATLVALGIVVFVLVRERLGSVPGVTAAAVVLFLGPAWEATLFISAGNHLAALTSGLWALLALEHRRLRRDAGACVLLVAAVAVSNTGVAMLAGAVIAVALRRRPRDLWIVAVPAAVFALWWLVYGHRQASGITVGHIAHLPGYVFDSVSAGLASATGMVHGGLPAALRSGHALTVVAAVAIAVAYGRGLRPRPYAWTFAGAAIAFWLLTGASAIPGRGAASSRYQITDATLLIILAAELLGEARLPRTVAALAAAAGVAVVASNLLVLEHGYDFLRVESGYARADLGALELAGTRAPARLWLLAPIAQDPYLSGVTAGRYFAVTRAHGSPPFDDVAGLARAPAAQRAAADSVLTAAYGLVPRAAGPASSDTGCRRADFRGTAPLGAPLPSGAVVRVNNAGPGVVALGVTRFGSTPHFVGFLAAHTAYSLALPADRARVPWRLWGLALTVAAQARVAVCQG